MLFERTQQSGFEIDARQFRVDFKDQRDKIKELTNRFIETTFDPIECYRLKLVALPIIESEGAKQTLVTIDRLLQHLASQYAKHRDRKLTIEQISADLEIPQESVASAVAYLIDTPVVGARSLGYPASPHWSLIPMEQSLDFPDLRSLLVQLAEWADRADANIDPATFPVAQPANHAPLTRFDRVISRFKSSRIAVAALLPISALMYFIDAWDKLSRLYSWLF